MELNEKAIDIKGKKYVLVKDRVIYLNEEHKNAQIHTEATFYPEVGMWVVKAKVYPDASQERFFNGHGQEIIGDSQINKTSALENAETSAVGRALAFMGIGVIDSIASVDEINKAQNRDARPKVNVLKNLSAELNKVSVEMTEEEVLEYLQNQPEFDGVPKDKILKVIEKKGLPYTAGFIRDRLKGGINE